MTETAESTDLFIATGRRKTASARVRLTRGSGKIQVNGLTIKEYFRSDLLVKTALEPLVVAELKDGVDIVAKVEGSGPAGQAGAISLGIARAVQKMNGDLRIPMKRQGLLRRDPRSRERKKPGRPGARKRFQFSKR